MMFDFSNAVWAEEPKTGRGKCKNTVSEKVDVYITQTISKSHKNPKPYMVIRIYNKKFKEVFKDVKTLSVGFLGDYVLLKEGSGYTVYDFANPEIRVPVELIEKCGRNPEKFFGGYLLKYDETAGLAYVDTSVGARV